MAYHWSPCLIISTFWHLYQPGVSIDYLIFRMGYLFLVVYILNNCTLITRHFECYIVEDSGSVTLLWRILTYFPAHDWIELKLWTLTIWWQLKQTFRSFLQSLAGLFFFFFNLPHAYVVQDSKWWKELTTRIWGNSSPGFL